MSKRHLNQPFDEVTAGGAADRDTIAEATRRAERRAGARVRAAAESTYEQAQAATEAVSQAVASAVSQAAVRVEAATSNDQPVRMARKAGALAGNTVRYLRDLEAEDLVTQVKTLVRRHPATLAGAAVAGFLAGRLLRR